MRATDGGYAPRFLGIFLTLGFSRFEGESTLPPTAANASRWAASRASFYSDMSAFGFHLNTTRKERLYETHN